MKKIFLIFGLLFTLPVFGQVDVPISTIGQVRDLVRGATWTSGQGGAGNNYIFTPSFRSELVTIFIENSGTGQMVGGALAYTSGDQTTKAFQSCATPAACFWVPITQLNGNGFILPAGGTFAETWVFRNAAVAVIPVLVTSGTTTVSITMVETELTTKGDDCNLTAFNTFPTATTAFLIPASLSNIHVCAYAISGPATTVAAELAFGVGSGPSGSCASSTTTWELTTGIGFPNYELASPGQLFGAGSGQALCFTNFGTGTTVTVSVTYWLSGVF
jgi:hypothetical protein